MTPKRFDTSDPTITITVPVHNEEHRLPQLLGSIAKQNYPQSNIEVLVVDGGSTDRSLQKCSSFACTVLHNPSRDPEVGKTIGCSHASGDLHMYMDADMEWSDDESLSNLVRPWQQNGGLAGSFPRYAVDPHDPPFNRYLSSHPLYQDPLMRFMSPQIGDTIVSTQDSYALCEFEEGKVPVVGVMLYPTSFVNEIVSASGPGWRWIDADFAVQCAERRLGPFAYVPSARIYHRSAMTPRLYLSKLRRNIRTVYFPTVDSRRSTYAAWDSKADLVRLMVWIVYANAVLPGVAVALIKALRLRDPALLYDAWATTVGTDYVALQFLADPRGRALISRAVKLALQRWSPRLHRRKCAGIDSRD
jgi:glycosyltransferase involved in cell wall biosynthesis